MPNLIVPCEPPNQAGRRISITPASAGWSYVGFEYYQLKTNQTMQIQTGINECCLVVMTGTVNVQAGDFCCESIGTRKSVFEDVPPDAVYIPNGRNFSVQGITDAEIGVCLAPGKGNYPAKHISSSSLKYVNRGKGTNTRHICDIMMGNETADSLLVVEVRTPSGHWSSYPPHKHDQDNLPHESYLEETYFHKVDPEQGYVLQRVYNDDFSLNETMSVYNNQVVMVPKGYHPVGVPYGYESYYLNVMAGPRREWVFYNDPNHEWIINAGL